MTYGRPSMVTPRISLKQDIGSISNLLPERLTVSSSITSSQTRFYDHALELHETLGCILAEFYDRSTAHASNSSLSSSPQNPCASIIKAQIFVQRISTGDFQSLLNFDNKLLAWRSKLPRNMRPENYEIPLTLSGTGNVRSQAPQNIKELTIVKRQAVVLHAR